MEPKTKKKQIDKELMIKFWQAGAETAKEDLDGALMENFLSVAIYSERYELSLGLIEILNSGVLDVKE